MAQGLRIADRLNEVVAAAVSQLPPVVVEPAEVERVLPAEKSAIADALVAFQSAALQATRVLREASIAAVDPTKALVDSLLDDFDALYEEVKAKSTAHEGRLQELADVERQQAETGRQIQAQRREIAELGDPAGELAVSRGQVFSLYATRSDRLATQCVALSASSEGLLRATLRRGQGLGAVQDALKGAVSGSNIRGSKIDSLVEALRSEDNPIATWEAALSEIEALASSPAEETVTTERFPTLGRLGFPGADLTRMSTKLTPDSWLMLAMTRVDDQPFFEYETREGEFIDFTDASAGQQATALMRVLLGQPGPPLIVDQPEDDLDSQVVLDVVERIWSAKHHKQLIFASHNANLVVNGDAELVVCCDYRVAGDQSGGRIKQQGAIDMPDVKAEITSVIEGGEKAFRLRKEKYGF